MVHWGEIRANIRTRITVDPDTNNSWEQAILSLDNATAFFWALALICYVGIDIVTTFYALSKPHFHEMNPVAVALITQYGGLGVFAGKAIVTLTVYLLWRAIPRPVAVSLPLGLATVGLYATVNNLYMLLH